MAKSIALVASLEGQAWAKAPDGTMRPLKVGDTVAAEEVVITATGAHIELDFGDGHTVAIAGGKEVTMSNDLWTDIANDNKDAAVDDASVQQALTVLNNGGDLTETLEETAAGLSGGGANEGHSFVELTRVVESSDSQAFNFSFNNPGQAGTEQNQASAAGTAPENNAPILAAQSFTGNEDTVIAGQIQANDVENDVLTYSLTGNPANGTLVLNAATGAFTYTPNANYNGPDSFVVTVTDDHGNVSTTTVTLGVNAVNDAPVSANQNLTTAEDTPVSGQVVATDVEGDTLAYSVSATATNGTVTLNPTTGTFTYTPGANFNGSDSFVVTISDGNGGTTTSTINIGVTPVNDAPVSNNQSLTTPEDTPLNGAVVASDVDGDTLSYAVTGNASNGTVTLNPATGTFVYTPNANYNGGDSFVVTISDGKGGTTTSTITIGVTPVNDAPVSANQNLTTAEDTPVNGTVVATDVDGDTLSYAVSTTAANGTVTLNPTTGAFVYTPNANYNGGDSFTVTISDGQGGTTTSVITIGVTPVNDAPVSSNQSLTTPEDTPVTGAVVASDLDGNTLTYAVTGNASNGTVALNPATGTFTYTPGANYNGGDSFTVTISDGQGGTTTSVITIGVTPVNDAPTAGNQNLTTPENTAINGTISASDVDGNTLGYSVSTTAAHGTVTLNPTTGAFVYTPNASYNGSDSFTVTVSDGNGGFTTSTVNIGVTPVNDVPVTADQTLTTPENTPLTGTVVATDGDGDTLSYTVTGVPANGTVVLNPATGDFTYTPNNGYDGGDSFTVTVDDGNGGTTTSTITIGVTNVNNVPVATDDATTTDEATAVTIAVRGNDVDPDGDTLLVTGVTQGANGSVVIDAVTGNPIYTPNAGFTGTDTFSYTIDDGHGGTDTATVTVTVNAVIPPNASPTAVGDSITLNEGGTVTILDGGSTSLLANDSDPETDPLTAILVTGPAHGTLTLNANGTFSYTHDGSEGATDSFTYKVNDGTTDGNTVTVNINVNPVNDAPVAVDDYLTTAHDTPIVISFPGLLANDTDAEGNPLSMSAIGSPVNGTLSFVGGNLVFTPTPGFVGVASLQYAMTDGHGGYSGAATIHINVTNAAPVTTADSITVTEGGTVTILDGGSTSLLANDTDAETDPLTAVLVTGPAHGTLTLNPNGTFSYTHDGSETTTDSFTYRANDGTANGNIVTVNIGVTPVNDAPVAADDNYTVDEGGTLVVTAANAVTLNDTDAEGDALSAILVTGPAHGTLTLNADGTFNYTHDGSNTTSDSFTYKVNDGTLDGNTVTVTIGVTPLNDVPVANADSITVAEGGTVTSLIGGATSVLDNDTDADLDTLNAVLVTGPTNGTLTFNADGTFSYTHNGSETTTDSFTYKVNDGTVDGNTVTVNIGVTPVNDAPVATDDSYTVGEGGTLVVTAANAVTLNDTDAENDPLSAILVTGPAHGTLTLNADGTFTYIHDGSETTSDSFTYKANDGTVDGNTVTVTIGVTPANDAPVAVADAITVVEGGTVTSLIGGATSVLDNDSDAENNPLNAVLVTGPANGTLTLNADGTFSYTHDGSATTTDSFTYKVNDGTVDGNTVTVNIGVTPVNHAPVANADSITVAEGGTVTSLIGGATSVLDNDTDADLDTLNAVLVAGPTNGTLTFNADGTFSYTHNGSETTTDSFTYKVNDGTVDGNTVTVNIGVTPVNDVPVTVADSITVLEGGTATSLVGGNTSVLTNDTDAENNTLNAVLVTGPAHGTLTLNANGTFSYVHDGSETTTDSFTYRANDGTANGNVVTVNIGITPVNDAPVAVADSITVLEGGTVTSLVGGATSVLANDTDAEGSALNATLVTGPTNGTLTFNADGTFSYTHNGSETTTDSFTYKVNDGTVDGNTVTVNIGVTPVNDAPVTVADSITVLEGGTATVLVGGNTSVLTNDTDVENNTLNAVLVTGPAHGTLTLNANGTFSYVHDGSETTTDSFTYRANDGTANGNVVTVNIGITPVNDAPVAVADSITVLEGGTVTSLVGGATSVLGNDTDADLDTLNAVLVTGPTNGTLTFNADGTFSYTHNGSETTTDSFTYKVNDGTVDGNTVTVNIGVTPVNDAPVTVVDSITVLEGGTATSLVGGNTSVLTNDTDAENNTLNAVLVTGPAHGTLTLNANGTFSYVHDGSETTTDSFTYRANDGTANGNVVTVNIGITPVNDAPVAVADSITVLEGGTVTSLVGGATSVLANDTDAEGSALNATLVTGPTNGTLTFNADGTFSYTHNGSETTTDSFTYKVNDGTVDGNTVTVNIGVTPVNDVPVAVNDPVSAAYSVQLGDAAANDLWSNVDSKGLGITVAGYKTNNAATTVYTGTVDGNANALGVGTGSSANANNTPRTGANNTTPASDVPNQIEYDVKTGKSEALELTFNGNLNSASFAVSRLYPGESGGEIGMWSAYYKGTLVASSTFRLSGSSNAGSFTISTGSLVFDSIKFLSLGTTDGTGDGADYFVTSFSGTGPASANTNYTVAEGSILSIGAASASKLLSNDTDADGDSLSVSQINGSNVTDGQTITLASGASLLIHSDGSFNYSTGNAFNSLSSGQVTTDSFTYTVSDGHGGTATATATMTVIGKNLTGTIGADTLMGGSHSETIMGLAGSDNMTGGLGADTFKWSLNDQGTAGSPAVDTITDFNTAQGDVLNLKDLLQNEGAGNITNYLHFASDGTNTTVSVSSIGAFNGSNYGTAADQTIVLNGVNLTGTDTDIINQLKNNGNLITD